MKKLLTGIFALILMLGCLTISQPRAMAADSPKEITAYLTIALQDTKGAYDFAKAKDGTNMASKAVQVSDVDGDSKLTAYDVLYCAHAQYAPGGLKDFAINSVANGAVILKKTWNVTASFTLVGKNTMATNTYATNLKSATTAAAISNGTHLYVVQGASAKTEFFSNTGSIKMDFVNDARITAYVGQPFTLCVNTYDTSIKMPAKRVSVTKNRDVYYKEIGKDETSSKKLLTTGADGKISVTFADKGDYLLYTVPSGGVAPAACIVHVEKDLLVPQNIQLGISEDNLDLLNYTIGTSEYTITVPDDAETLYGQVGLLDAEPHLKWYSETSASDDKWSNANVNGVLDEKTTTSISIKGIQKFRLYINDVSLQTAKNAPLSAYYTFNIKRQVQLSDLTTSGAVRSDADFRTGNLDVYVAYDAETATLMPKAADGVTITVGDQEVTSGMGHTVTLTGADTVVKITVHRDGDNFVDGEYAVTFHKASDQAAPVFIEQPVSEVQEYIVGDDAKYVKPLYVFASANDTVTYQWYSSTTNRTENGMPIEGETGRSYTPTTTEAGERYYYCIAKNGDTSTASTFAHIIVYEYPIRSISWSMAVPNLPEDENGKFGTHDTGFYYHKGDTDVSPLTVSVEFEPHFAELIDRGEMIVSYSWGPKNNTVTTDSPSYAPSTEYAIGGQEWYCRIRIYYLDYSRQFSKDTDSTVYVYIDNADSSRPDKIDFIGDGSETSPWELSSQADLEKMREYVNEGFDFSDTYLVFTKDISLDKTWTPIGIGNEGTKGKGWLVFSGTLDGGGHTLTYEEDSEYPLFAFVREATVKNLDIKAPHIKNYALVSNYTVDYGDDGIYGVGSGGSYAPGCPDTIDIINVTIKENSIIDKGGFLGGYASGANVVNIQSCTIEKNVTIGTGSDSNIGSFAGLFNGTITDCVSYANVTGYNFVGGLVGQKGQSMGPYKVVNSSFHGTVAATGVFIGGIAGGGYAADSAPNTPAATIQNCYVTGTIIGADCVGGIFGGEPSQLQSWNKSYIQDNCFYGTVTATEENASYGAIVGQFKSLNANNIIENNYFLDGCGTEIGLGSILYLDTSAEVEAPEGCTVVNTGEKLPDIEGFKFSNLNRTDDPLGKDAEKLAAMKTAGEFKDGTVVNLLNNSESSWKNWTKGTNGPVHTREPIFFKLEVSGSYKETYKPGEELDLTGIKFTAYRSDGTSISLTLKDVEQLNEFDPQLIGEQEITFQYGVGQASIYVSVIKEYTDDDRENFSTATVLFSLSDDDQFVTSDSVTLSNVPITVTYFDLANYGLERYYCYDKTGNPVEQPTMLHLFIVALEQYKLGLDESECGKGALKNALKQNPALLNVTGGAGSMYMQNFWNHDDNLTYFYNGDYPLRQEHVGATADEILLKDGDFVDVAMFKDRSFYTDPASGFHFFSADGKTPQKTFTVEKGSELKLTYLLAHANMKGDHAIYTAVPGMTVYYAKSMDTGTIYTAGTDETDGTVTLNFPDTGTWYVWVYGARGGTKNSVISAPGCATVTVTPSQAELDQAKADEVKKLIEAIGEVTEDSGSAIDAARKAYDALTPAQQELVDNYEDLVNAENAYQAILDKKAAERVEALIDAIGVVTKDSGDAIKAARDAYDALTPAQRKLVGNYGTLLAAEKRYEDLTKPVTPVEPSKPTKPSTKPTDEPTKPDASKFVDVSKNNWYFDAVQYVLENGLMNGTSANEFSPNANTTRGMIVTILARLDGVDTSGSSPWYAAGRTWAMNADVSDGTNMEGKITREQLAAMLYRYAKLKGYDVSASADISAYTDASGVSSWATDAMRWAVGAGLINGRTATTLAPQGNATRAEVAAILMRFAQKIAK